MAEKTKSEATGLTFTREQRGEEVEFAIVDEDVRVVAVLDNTEISAEEQEVYARRFCASDDLLAACEEWVRFFDRLDRDSEPGDPLAEARRQFHAKRVQVTRSAIAKAKGTAV